MLFAINICGDRSSSARITFSRDLRHGESIFRAIVSKPLGEPSTELGTQAMKLFGLRRVVEGQRASFHGLICLLVPDKMSLGKKLGPVSTHLHRHAFGLSLSSFVVPFSDPLEQLRICAPGRHGHCGKGWRISSHNGLNRFPSGLITV